MPEKKQTTKTQKKQTTAQEKTSKLVADVVDMTGKKTGTVTLPKEVFQVTVAPQLLAQVVRVYQINKRQGGAHTKTRGDVTGSSRKIWRQKGTGRARHGDRYAPIFVGGGIAHGPKHQEYEAKITKTMRRKALYAALTKLYKDKRIVVVDGLEKAEPKTKVLVNLLSTLNTAGKQQKRRKKVLFTTPGKLENIWRAGRNIQNLTVCDASLLNTYEVLNTQQLIIAKDAISVLQKTFTV